MGDLKRYLKAVAPVLLGWALGALVCLFITLALSSCKTQYVPVETVRTEKEYVDRVRIDTVEAYRDRLVERKGDTVYSTELRYVRKIEIKTDTLVREKVDSVQVPYPVPAELSKWQMARIDGFPWACGGCIALAALLWAARRRRL